MAAPGLELLELFAVNLSQARTAAGLSQHELGRRADLHRTEISLLECARREPRLGTLVRLADSLGTDVDALRAGLMWDVRNARYLGRPGGR